MTLKNECAMGSFPMQGSVEEDREDMLRQFAPRGDIRDNNNGSKSAICHGCDQWTMIKQVMPRKGYFVFHNASVQGSAPGFSTGENHGNRGKPARVRGREIYVKRSE